MKIKKILYVGSKFEQNQKDIEESLNFRSFYKTFLELGFETQYVCFKPNNKDLIDNEIELKLNDFNPDLIFFILQQDQVSKNLLVDLKKRYFTVNFFGDDNWRFNSFSKQYAKYFSLCLTDSLYFYNNYKSIGVDNVIEFQWGAHKIKNLIQSKLDYQHDVSFIGSYSPYREWIINFLSKNNIKVDCFGIGWGSKIVDKTEYEHIIQHSKINLNLSNSLIYDLRFLMKYPKSLAQLIINYFTKKLKIGGEIKARLFEITGYNGFLVTEYVPTIENYFDLKNEICCFSDREQLLSLILFYLNNENLREKKKKNGFEKSLNSHLYEKRLIKLLKHIEDEYSKKN